MSKEISIKLKVSELHQKLKQLFKPEHSELMSQAIMEIIDSDYDLENLFKASIGIIPQTNYFVNDVVSVQTSGVSNWSMDLDKMKEAGMVVEDCIIGTIVHVRPFSKNKTYILRYDYLNKEGLKNTINSDIYPSYVRGLVEVFPGDERVNTDEDDLPF
jgi:hypothetical protein